MALGGLRKQGRPRSSAIYQEKFLWLIPVLVAIFSLMLGEKHIADIIGACIGLGLFAFFVRRPGPALITLVIFLPLEQSAFGILYKLHVPGTILRPASSFKELLGICILVAGILQIRDAKETLDRIDIALLAYVGVVCAYLAVPHLFSSIAPTGWSARILAWRSDCGYPLVFFGARHASIHPRYKRAFVRAVISLAMLTGIVGLYQRIDPASWGHWILVTGGQLNYQFNVLGSTPYDVATQFRYLFNTSPLHVSSIFFSPYDLGDYLIIAVAIAGELITANRRSVIPYLLLGVSLACIFFTESRSDGVGALIILLLIAIPAPRHPIEGRLRVAAVILVGAVIVIPSLSGTRFVDAQGGAVSNSGHITEIEDGIGYIIQKPLGLGLGDQPSTATRFVAETGLPGNDISDNSITQVGDELGIQALIPWLAMMLFVLLALRRRAKSGDSFAAMLGLALLGILIAGQFHHVFLLYAVPWTVWSGAGLALSTYRPSGDDGPLANPANGLSLGRATN